MSKYLKQAKQFLKDTNTKMSIVFMRIVSSKELGWNNMEGRNWYHNSYKVTMSRNGKSYSFPFHDSYDNYCKGKRPTPYDILACLQKYEVESDVFEFAREFGYEITSKEEFKKVSKTHKDCINQYNKLLRLFDDDMEIMVRLSEIY